MDFATVVDYGMFFCRRAGRPHEGQIEMVKVQKDADAMQKAAEANARAELYRALLRWLILIPIGFSGHCCFGSAGR